MGISFKMCLLSRIYTDFYKYINGRDCDISLFSKMPLVAAVLLVWAASASAQINNPCCFPGKYSAVMYETGGTYTYSTGQGSSVDVSTGADPG